MLNDLILSGRAIFFRGASPLGWLRPWTELSSFLH